GARAEGRAEARSSALWARRRWARRRWGDRAMPIAARKTAELLTLPGGGVSLVTIQPATDAGLIKSDQGRSIVICSSGAASGLMRTGSCRLLVISSTRRRT